MKSLFAPRATSIRLLLGAVMLAASFAGATAPEAGALESPILLAWTHHAEHLPNLTHVTPAATQLAGGGGPVVVGRAPGQVPMELRTVDGKVVAEEMSPKQIADYWSSAAGEGFPGIAVDEFGHPDEVVNEKMAQALHLFRSGFPHLFVAVWHAGRLTDDLIQAYRKDADLVILETYVSGSDSLDHRFLPKLEAARDGGILEKSVFALGINDQDPRLGVALPPWANTRGELEAQMRWIRDNAPKMPGIAFFSPRASVEIEQTAVGLASKIFLTDQPGGNAAAQKTERQ